MTQWLVPLLAVALGAWSGVAWAQARENPGSPPAPRAPRGTAGEQFLELHGESAGRQHFVERLQRLREQSAGQAVARLLVDPEKVGRERAAFATALRQRRPSRELYEAWIDRIGANGILDGIERFWPTCHSEAHDLGKVIYRRVRDIGKGLVVCADRCYSGCMHGVLMEAFTEAPQTPAGGTDLAAFKPLMHDVCYRDPEMTAAYSPGDCAHGIGHALMFLTRYDVGRAIGGCNGFDAPAMRYYCATGAYMEYVGERDVVDATERSLFYPCDQYPYPAACARHKMGRVAIRHYRAGRPLVELVAECKRLQGRYRLGCFHGLGNAHMVLIGRGLLSLGEVCGHGDEREQVFCIEGAMERMAKYNEASARKVCAGLTGAWRQTCQGALVHKMYSMTRDLSAYLE